MGATAAERATATIQLLRGKHETAQRTPGLSRRNQLQHDVGELDREASQTAMQCELGPDPSCASFSNRIRWPLLTLLAALSVLLGVLATQLPWGGMSRDREEDLYASFSAYSSYFGALALVVLVSMCICSERPVPEEVQQRGGFVARRCQFGRDCHCCVTRGNRIRWWLGGTAIFVGVVLLAAGAVPQGSWSGTCADCHDVFQILLEVAAMLLAPGVLLVLSTACCAELPIAGHKIAQAPPPQFNITEVAEVVRKPPHGADTV